MRPKSPPTQVNQDMFRSRLENILDLRHELIQLSNCIAWERFDEAFGGLYSEGVGCPGKPIRLMVGLQYLKHLYGLSDEAVVRAWRENPYWQYFCGEEYFRHDLPVDGSSMTRFRQRIGKDGCELLLQGTIQAGLRSGAVKPLHLRRVTVDTTVQEKAVSFPTDSKLLNRSRERLVRWSNKHGLKLRQSYVRKGPEALQWVSRYARARQYKRMRAPLRKLHTILGRVVRDIERKVAHLDEVPEVLKQELAMARRLLVQKKKSKNKLYSLHAPEVECISKGKAHKRYEFGVKVSIAVTNVSNFVVGAMALPKNPFDGHSLAGALAQVRRLTGKQIEEVFVDRGYRGHGEKYARVYISGQRRGVRTVRLRKSMKRRQAIEPVIGHLKSDGLLGRNYLKGTEGDAIHVVLCGCGQNLRIILRELRIFCLRILWPITTHTTSGRKTTVSAWFVNSNFLV